MSLKEKKHRKNATQSTLDLFLTDVYRPLERDHYEINIQEFFVFSAFVCNFLFLIPHRGLLTLVQALCIGMHWGSRPGVQVLKSRKFFPSPF